MSDDETPEDEAPVHVISDYRGAIEAIRTFRENGTVIVDFRAAEKPEAARIVDVLNGAGLAHGYSPFGLAPRVFFLTKNRFPYKHEKERFRT